ncbi:amidase family protein [Paraburkholderia bannensis]|uniref:amidase family protein n=1 Tax=Paraburkholderia bannensis TaxID=765414 RepID=UPI002ABD3385|nr:amidase family protein [Paraburkholderia bannensis]
MSSCWATTEATDTRAIEAARVIETASSLGLSLSHQEVDVCVAWLAEQSRLQRSAVRIGATAYSIAPRGREFVVPGCHENQNNAWHVKCHLKSISQGQLAGKTLVVDDSVAVGGLPLRVGTDIFRGHYPSVDAEVATRALSAGAIIVGKGNCEYLRLGYGSSTSVGGRIHNPRSPRHSAGGPSSGVAALVAAGEAEMAIGVGAYLLPAALCGLFAVRPTAGLVPTEGVFRLGPAWDHIGPIATTLDDAQRLHSVLVGARWARSEESRLSSPEPIRIGVVRESFDGLTGGCVRAAEQVRRTFKAMSSTVVKVSDVSIPVHSDGFALYKAAGSFDLKNRLALSSLELASFCGGVGLATDFSRFIRQPMQLELAPVAVKAALATDIHARNASGDLGARMILALARLRLAYDEMLARFDVLALATVSGVAAELSHEDAACGKRSEELVRNIAPFELTGHPAVTIPCGVVDGLPVGLMLVGRHYCESEILRIAALFAR